MHNQFVPQVGSILLSEPFMLDPNFTRSVILLCEHNDDGTIGLIINQPSNLSLNDVMVGMDEAHFPLFIGGPVAQNSIQFVHRAYDKLNSGIQIGEDLYWGGNFEALKLLIDEQAIKEHEIKFFIGYSGWQKGQLEKELKENAWIVGNSYNPGMVYENDSEDLWKQAVISLGPRYAHIASFPQNPNWN
nr:YqgE/AlgH family protein [Olivibacter sitiensis]